MAKASYKKNKQLVQGALLIAIAVILQALRLIIPFPLPFSTFIIGTLVHMMLALTAQINGLRTALLLSCVLPIFAYAQGQLLLPVLIPIVILGNMLFVFFVRQFYQGWRLIIPPLAKSFAMGLATKLALALFSFKAGAAMHGSLFAMTIPQLITGILGILLAQKLKKRFRRL